MIKLVSDNGEKKIQQELVRLARNCQFYKGEGDKIHFINEAGALRGMMYAADALKIVYLKHELYENYIKPAYEMMNQG